MSCSEESDQCDAPSPFHDAKRWVSDNEYAFALPDAYPVTEGHTLVVPRRAVKATSELSDLELVACFKLIEETKLRLAKELGAEGFNVGVNEGVAAGQTVNQLHFHVIPRRHGDMTDPIGGVRNIFPGKGDYLKGERDN